MFLTDDELGELTGYKRHADQRGWLSRNAIPYWVSARGKPKVLRSALEPQAVRQPGEPDWQYLP